MTDSGSNRFETFEKRQSMRGAAAEIDVAIRAILDAASRQGYDKASCFAIRLALEEALANAVRHGNRGDVNRLVQIAWSINRESAKFEIEDEGEGFDAGAIPDPTAEENLEVPSGRGIVLMRAYMTVLEFMPPGNRVRMEFRPRAMRGDR
jgi:serine/threonine-protein kinase RsbW